MTNGPSGFWCRYCQAYQDTRTRANVKLANAHVTACEAAEIKPYRLTAIDDATPWAGGTRASMVRHLAALLATEEAADAVLTRALEARKAGKPGTAILVTPRRPEGAKTVFVHYVAGSRCYRAGEPARAA
jgi:hypothetical protein